MRNGIHKREHTELKELKSSDKGRSLPLEGSWQVSERSGDNALLSLEETDNILQNKTVCVPCEGDFTVVFDQKFWLSDKDRNTLCKADKG